MTGAVENNWNTRTLLTHKQVDVSVVDMSTSELTKGRQNPS